jgi:hypothetical protein
VGGSHAEFVFAGVVYDPAFGDGPVGFFPDDLVEAPVGACDADLGAGAQAWDGPAFAGGVGSGEGCVHTGQLYVALTRVDMGGVIGASRSVRSQGRRGDSGVEPRAVVSRIGRRAAVTRVSWVRPGEGW